MFAMKHAAVVVAVGSILAFGAMTPSFAAASDYEFQLVDQTLKHGAAVVVVRLVDKRTNRPVPDAVIYQTRLDMGPDGMATMTTPATPVPGTRPGVYLFKTNLMMAGNWALSLAAKVQGETETVTGRMTIKATP